MTTALRMRSDAPDLVGQFVLCRSDASGVAIPQGWEVRGLRDWSLASHPRLPVTELMAADRSRLGWLLGYAVHPKAGLLSTTYSLDVNLTAASDANALEGALYELGGRFVAIILTPEVSRVYLDPYGLLSVVFCPSQGVVASSNNLIPRSDATPDAHELSQALGLPPRDARDRRERYFPFGLTARRGIERLTPNHFLDLSSWDTVRHWPQAEELILGADPAEAVEDIATLLESEIAALTRAGPMYMRLTAGIHTRMLLASARKHLDRIRFFTLGLPDDWARLDVVVAPRIAHHLGLDYSLLQWEEATHTDLEEWIYRTGACVASRAAGSVRTLRQLDPTRGIFTGFGGSPGQETWWTPADLATREMSSVDVLDLIRMPTLPEIVDRARRWLGEFPLEGRFWVANFLHIEQMYGCWGGPQEYGVDGTTCNVSPYCHRRFARRFLTLPPVYRHQRELIARDLIRSRWPELLRFPINQPIGAEAWRLMSQRVVKRVLLRV